MVSSSFFTDGGVYDTADVVSNDAPGSTTSSQAPSSFFQGGNVYMPVTDVAATLDEVAADAAAASASATAAATSAASAGSAAAAAVASATGTATPLIDGTASVGTSTKWAHEDHRHPTDTSRADAAATTAALALKADKTYVDTQDALKAPLASPALTGSPTAPTATAGTNTTQLATTAFVQTALPVAATATPLVDGTAAVGVATKYAREDHVHPAPPFSALTSKPTTVAGYGITDALTAASFPAWTPYTVTVSGITGGTVTSSGRFFKIGKLVFVTIIVVITSTLTGTMSVNLPAAAVGGVALAAKETAVGGIGGTAFGGGSVVPLLKDDGSQFLTNGMNIIISGTYEAA